VIVDGARAVFPGPGVSAHPLSLSPGPHRFEAVLVDGAGQEGPWRFDLAQLGVVPGSLRVVAGEVVQIGPARVAFALTGDPGERVVFTVRVGER
jgi:hypothetical protein